MTSAEFWQVAYPIALSNNHSPAVAKVIADEAVEDYESFMEDTD